MPGKPIKEKGRSAETVRPPDSARPAELTLYLQHLAANDKSSSTIENYGAALTRLFLYHGGLAPADYKPEDVDAFLVSIRKGSSKASTNLAKSAIRGFFGFMLDLERIQKDPSRLIRNAKIERKSPPIFDAAAWDRFLDGISAAIGQPPAYRPLRDWTLCTLFRHSGLRVSELVDLDVVDVAGRPELEVIGKGTKKRLVPLNETAQNAIGRYLPLRRALKAKDDKALFLSRRGRRLGVRSVQRAVKAWLKKAGIQRDLWPHLIRHMFLTDVQNKYRNLRATQTLAGHKHVTTTQIYTHVEDQQLKEAVKSIG